MSANRPSRCPARYASCRRRRIVTCRTLSGNAFQDKAAGSANHDGRKKAEAHRSDRGLRFRNGVYGLHVSTSLIFVALPDEERPIPLHARAGLSSCLTSPQKR